MPSDAMIGHGTLFQTLDSSWLTVAEVVTIDPPSAERDFIDTSHELAPNEWRTSIPGMKSPGEVTITFNFVPGESAYNDLYDELADQDVRARRVVFPNGAILPFNAFLKSLDSETPMEGVIRATATFQVAGEPGRVVPESETYTKVLLHFNGADASTTITDSNLGGSAHVWTAHNTAQLDTSVKKFGTAALLCGAGALDWVSTPDHGDFALGSGDFTIDCWFNCTAAAGPSLGIAGQEDNVGTNATRSFRLYRAPAGHIVGVVGLGGDGSAVAGATLFTNVLNTGWHHVALVRYGDVLSLYVDGILESTAAITGSVNNGAGTLSVGRLGELGFQWVGSIDEFRLSVGTARWTSPFDVPEFEYE